MYKTNSCSKIKLCLSVKTPLHKFILPNNLLNIHILLSSTYNIGVHNGIGSRLVR